MNALRRFLVPILALAFVVVAAVVVFGGGSDQRTLTAYFPRTIALYEGSDVRVLGVPIGHIEEVTPDGTRVKVVMSYDADVKVPSTAEAVIISPSIVGDRYVQLTPAYKNGDVLEDDAVIDVGRTAVPLELDEIYSSIDRLTVALGPDGANADGALTDLLQQTAKNFGGQGEKFNETLKNFSRLSETLDDNKEELFGSTAALQRFITKLAENDQTVRDFNSSLGQASEVLSAERDDLAQALKFLAVALDEVGGFVAENRASLGRNIRGLNRVAKVLVRQRAALEETLEVAPLALNNLQLTYNPDAGTLDTNANIGNLEHDLVSNPKDLLCALISSNDESGTLCDLINTLPLPRVTPFGTGSSSGAVSDPTLGGLVEVAR
ncbi:MCE family protein [Nocardioides sp. R-C-SC26]|uniref:MCE family protein n=1 Tax=Nocardioides sp. R-C-SC26 TaxID=2870414 RepID=UPI001E486506|nr:MCE family protein [Nocardioides sp. R-C-SC26]